jgi:hypothetical protein
MDKRKTDGSDNVAHFRAGSRIFRLNDVWYFASREGEQGPFTSEQEANKELDSYLKLVGGDDGLDKIEYEPTTRRADPTV